MTDLILTPGDVSLAAWRAIHGGLGARLHASAAGKIAASAAAVARIIARGEPVYGINTGFGKLASVRIEAGDLETLQRNIVLSHAAGVGEPAPRPVVRLMMALKLASLGQGASGVKPETIALLEALLTRKLTPVVPAQGSVGASGDLAPLAHLALALVGEGRVWFRDAERPTMEALKKLGWRRLKLAPKEGLALINGTNASVAIGALAVGTETIESVHETTSSRSLPHTPAGNEVTWAKLPPAERPAKPSWLASAKA